MTHRIKLLLPVLCAVWLLSACSATVPPIQPSVSVESPAVSAEVLPGTSEHAEDSAVSEIPEAEDETEPVPPNDMPEKEPVVERPAESPNSSTLPEQKPAITPEELPATPKPSENTGNITADEEKSIVLSVDGNVLDIAWEKNESVDSLLELLRSGDITISTTQYGGFEQVGSLPQSLPRDDVQMSTQAGDIVLYSGNQIVLFYGSNSWAYTKLGHINGLSAEELTSMLGNELATIFISIQ